MPKLNNLIIALTNLNKPVKYKNEDLGKSFNFNCKVKDSKLYITDRNKQYSYDYLDKKKELFDSKKLNNFKIEDEVMNKIKAALKKDNIKCDNIAWEDDNTLVIDLNDAPRSNHYITLTKRRNDYDESVIKEYVNGKLIEDLSYYTDDWEDAVNTLNFIARQKNKNVEKSSNGYFILLDSKSVLKQVKYGIIKDKFNEFKKYINDIGFDFEKTGKTWNNYIEVIVKGDSSSDKWDKLEKNVKNHFASDVANSKLQDDDFEENFKSSISYEDLKEKLFKLTFDDVIYHLNSLYMTVEQNGIGNYFSFEETLKLFDEIVNEGLKEINENINLTRQILLSDKNEYEKKLAAYIKSKKRDRNRN